MIIDKHRVIPRSYHENCHHQSKPENDYRTRRQMPQVLDLRGGAGYRRYQKPDQLPVEQSLHASNHEITPALVGINVLISGGMGAGLFRRLMQQGIQPVITPEENLDQALSDFLANKLERLFPDVAHACHDHTH